MLIRRADWLLSEVSSACNFLLLTMVTSKNMAVIAFHQNGLKHYDCLLKCSYDIETPPVFTSSQQWQEWVHVNAKLDKAFWRMAWFQEGQQRKHFSSRKKCQVQTDILQEVLGLDCRGRGKVIASGEAPFRLRHLEQWLSGEVKVSTKRFCLEDHMLHPKVNFRST